MHRLVHDFASQHHKHAHLLQRNADVGEWGRAGIQRVQQGAHCVVHPGGIAVQHPWSVLTRGEYAVRFLSLVEFRDGLRHHVGEVNPALVEHLIALH